MSPEEIKKAFKELAWSKKDASRFLKVTMRAVDYWLSGERIMSKQAQIALKLFVYLKKNAHTMEGLQ